MYFLRSVGWGMAILRYTRKKRKKKNEEFADAAELQHCRMCYPEKHHSLDNAHSLHSICLLLLYLPFSLSQSPLLTLSLCPTMSIYTPKHFVCRCLCVCATLMVF